MIISLLQKVFANGYISISVILFSSLVSFSSSAHAGQCTEDGSGQQSSVQISVGNRPRATAFKIDLGGYQSKTYKITCDISELNDIIPYKLAISDESGLNQVKVSLFLNGKRAGSGILNRGRILKLNIDPKIANDYTLIYEAINGEGSVYHVR